MRPLTLALLLALAGCASETPVPDDTPLRFLALGDSYTIGEGVAAHERWPVQLAEALRQSGAEITDPEIVARTGWTTRELNSGIDAADPRGPYALVTLLIGVNNQYRGLPVEDYRREVRGLMERAIAFAGGEPGRVVVVSFPDWGVTPFAEGRDRAQIAREVDAFNAIAMSEARSLGLAWVDVTPLSRTQGEMVVEDKLHPAGEAYAAWTDLILPAARAALTESPGLGTTAD